MSSQVMALFDRGLISCGFVRGMSRSVRQMKYTIRPMNTIISTVLIVYRSQWRSRPRKAGVITMS
jgi:hypothetical protein